MKNNSKKKAKMTASEKLSLELNSIPNKFATRLLSSFTNKKTFNKFVTPTVQRNLIQHNVCKLMRSFKMFGTGGSNITIVKTSAFGVKDELITADGQHSIEAAKLVGVGLNGRIVELVDDTKENVLRYIATLNNCRVGWSNKTYLNGNIALGKAEYVMFDMLMTKHKLTITDLLHIFLGGSSNKEAKIYKDGEMEFINEKEALRLLKAVVKVKDALPDKAYARRSLYRVMRMTNNYNKFAEKIINADVTFTENETALYLQLIKIHKSDELAMA